MEELITRLENIDFTDMDVDELLDKRDEEAFDSEWMRVYNELEKLKQENVYTEENRKHNSDIREIAFRKVYELSGDSDLAGYVSDDFGMILDSRLLGFSDDWLDRMVDCYMSGYVPCGILQ